VSNTVSRRARATSARLPRGVHVALCASNDPPRRCRASTSRKYGH
jgi:hypothetical protein